MIRIDRIPTRLLISLILLLSAPTSYAQVDYHIHPLNESELTNLYLTVLREGWHVADRDWHVAPFDAKAGYWGDGVSAGNEGTRAVAGMILASATLAKFDDSLSPADRQVLIQKASAALEYVTATHVVGTQKCTDNKSWGATSKFGGESWQSGMWTGTIATGAWLIWDQLDPQLRKSIQNVVASEDDILVVRKPPNGSHLDTKAEENGWEVPTLVLGELMFPDHPRAKAWHQTAIRYMMNTLCTDPDTHDESVVDGEPTNQWVGGANLQPDFTLENHNIFHPSYVACSSYFLTQSAMYYTFAGKPIPQAATHHLADTWKMYQSIILPWGEVAYPQSMDWELHGLPYINLFASFATHDQDRFASRAEQSILQCIRTWQTMDAGSLCFPGSKVGFARHSINCEQVAYGFLAHKIFGKSAEPLTEEESAKQEEGSRDYPYVDFIAHRTAKKFASFSWKNHVMGLLMPIGPGHENNPDFVTPIQNGLIGSFDLLPRGNLATKPLDHVRTIKPDGFETTGVVSLDGGRLKQAMHVVSIGSQTLVYEDQVTAEDDVTIDAERGVPIGIENDEITGGIRRVTDESGDGDFKWKSPAPLKKLSGSWANVDGRIGVISLKGSGLAYAQSAGYSPGISVCSDILYASFSDHPRPVKSGEIVASRIAVFFVEVTPAETVKLAATCKIDGQTLTFKQPDGQDVTIQLMNDK